MPVMDGLTFVEEARKSHPQLAFIMPLQVSSKDMIADAYEKALNFCPKPVNSVELETVIKKVSASLSMNRAFLKMQNLFQQEMQLAPQPAAPAPREAPHSGQAGRRCSSGWASSGTWAAGTSSNLWITSSPMAKTWALPTLRELCGKFSQNPNRWSSASAGRPAPALSTWLNLGLEGLHQRDFYRIIRQHLVQL